MDAVEAHPMVAAAAKLVPILRDNRSEADAANRMTPRVRDALSDAGAFRLLAPRDVGGHQAPFPVMARTLEQLASGDTGAAWHVLNASMAGILAGHVDYATRAALFAGRDTHFGQSLVPGGRAQRVDGGFTLTGRWPFVTGILEARYAVLAGFVYEGEQRARVDGTPDLRWFFVEVDKLTIDDTWRNAAGMRSSGSNAATAESVFIPEAHACSPRQPATVDDPLYKAPPLLAYITAAPPIYLGVLQAALDATIESASTKKSRLTGTVWRDLVTVQQTVAFAVAVGNCCRAGIRRVYEDLQANPSPSQLERAVFWATMGYTYDQVRDAVSRLSAASGSDVFLNEHGASRAVRDIHLLGVALEQGRGAEHSAGAVFLGGEPTDPGF